MKIGKSKFYDLTTQEIEKDEGSFFVGGPGAEEEIAAAPSAEASPGPVKRTTADLSYEHGTERDSSDDVEPGICFFYHFQ